MTAVVGGVFGGLAWLAVSLCAPVVLNFARATFGARDLGTIRATDHGVQLWLG
jgi:hypothetical protein